MSMDFVETAFWTWLRKYVLLVQHSLKPDANGALCEARNSLFLSNEEAARRLGRFRTSWAKLEKSEIKGTVSLKAMHEAAEALGCEFVYFIQPKHGMEFSRVVWESVLPGALEHPSIQSADPKNKAKVLAGIAIDLLNDPKFRRKQKWARRKF